ncbi:23241_t:CDS:2, partial [Racocetra persica]
EEPGQGSNSCRTKLDKTVTLTEPSCKDSNFSKELALKMEVELIDKKDKVKNVVSTIDNNESNELEKNKEFLMKSTILDEAIKISIALGSKNELVIFEYGVKDDDDGNNVNKDNTIDRCNEAGVDQDKNRIGASSDERSGKGENRTNSLKKGLMNERTDSDRMLIKKVFALYDSRGRYQRDMDHNAEVVLEGNLNISVVYEKYVMIV